MKNKISVKVSEDSLIFFVKLKHNIKTVRMDTAKNILKAKEPSIAESMDFIVRYFKENNKNYQEMIKANVE